MPASAIDGTEAKEITTAYAILRHNGVALGKADYLMGAQAGA